MQGMGYCRGWGTTRWMGVLREDLGASAPLTAMLCESCSAVRLRL